jgi:hypothetical protein
MTKRIQSAGQLIGIELVDHLIVGGGWICKYEGERVDVRKLAVGEEENHRLNQD